MKEVLDSRAPGKVDGGASKGSKQSRNGGAIEGSGQSWDGVAVSRTAAWSDLGVSAPAGSKLRAGPWKRQGAKWEAQGTTK